MCWETDSTDTHRLGVIAVRDGKHAPLGVPDWTAHVRCSEGWTTGSWRAYTRHWGKLLVTPVEHEPWPLRQAHLQALEENLTDSVGLEDLREPAVVHFSDGVGRVRLGRPTLLRT